MFWRQNLVRTPRSAKSVKKGRNESRRREKKEAQVLHAWILLDEVVLAHFEQVVFELVQGEWVVQSSVTTFSTLIRLFCSKKLKKSVALDIIRNKKYGLGFLPFNWADWLELRNVFPYTNILEILLKKRKKRSVIDEASRRDPRTTLPGVFLNYK